MKDVRLKNEINYTANKYLINHFRLKKKMRQSQRV